MTTSAVPPPITPRTTLTVRSTEDVLAIVPVAIGFHPTDSLVLVTFGSATNMPDDLPTGVLGGGGFHARVDMPRRPEHVDAVVEPLHHAVRCHRPELGAVVVYSADVELGARTGAAAEAAFAGEGMHLIEVVQVHDGQWWELPGPRPRPHWDPERHDFDLSSHPILAERVFAGQVVHESRQAVADSLRSDDLADQRRIAAAVDGVTDRWCEGLTTAPFDTSAARVRDSEVDWMTALLADGRPLSPGDVARMLTLVQMGSVRDRVCVGLTRRQAAEQLEVWRELVRRAPPRLVSGAAAVLALVAWLAGDGALAWCAIDRCHEVEPDNLLAATVAAALQSAVPPSAWEEGAAR